MAGSPPPSFQPSEARGNCKHEDVRSVNMKKMSEVEEAIRKTMDCTQYMLIRVREHKTRTTRSAPIMLKGSSIAILGELADYYTLQTINGTFSTLWILIFLPFHSHKAKAEWKSR